MVGDDDNVITMMMIMVMVMVSNWVLSVSEIMINIICVIVSVSQCNYKIVLSSFYGTEIEVWGFRVSKW